MVRLDEQLDSAPEAYTSWIRMGGVAVWQLIEEQPGSGSYNFTQADSIIHKAVSRNIQLLVTIDPQHNLDEGAGQKALPSDMQAFKSFVTNFVERYDGDGFEDAPGSPIVRHWQIGNEPGNETPDGGKVSWNDTPENYAVLLRESAEAIRAADPDAVVLIAGMATGLSGLDNFYEAVFQELDTFGGGPHFDIFDIHWFVNILPGNQYSDFSEVIDAVRASITAHGYGNIPIWATEVAFYSGSPEGYDPVSEEDHAGMLAKMLLFYRSLDVNKIFWAPYKEFHEWQGLLNGYFDNTGLVNNELNDGQSHKKKAYYTYRFLADKLDGAVFVEDSPLVAQFDRSGLHFCEFTNYDKTYYAFWVDNPDKAGLELPIPTDAAAFKLYPLIPDADNEIIPTILPNNDDTITVTLDTIPVLVEHFGAGPYLEIVSPTAGMLTTLNTLDMIGLTDPFEELRLEGPYGASDRYAQADSNGDFNFSGISLAEGHNVLAVNAGSGDSSSIEVLHVVLDTISPNLTVSYPEDGSSINAPEINVQGFADPGSEVTLDYLSAPVPMNVTADSVTGEYIFPEVVFTEGLNVIHVNTEDPAGNVTDISVEFLIDTQAPQISDYTRGDVVDDAGPYEVYATATDNDQIVDIFLYYTVDGDALIELPMALENGNLYRAEIPGQPFGTQIAYQVKAVDRAGNIRREPQTVNVTFRVIDSHAPVITDVTELSDSDDAQNPYLVTAAISDNHQLAAVHLLYRVNGGALISVPLTDDGGGAYRAEIPPQPLFSLVGYGIEAMDTFGNRAYDPLDLPQGGVYEFHIAPEGTQDVAVVVLPANVQIKGGQNLVIDIALHNLTHSSETISLKLFITASNGAQKDLLYRSLTLPPAAHLNRQLEFPIPVKTPPGTYTFSAVVFDLSGNEIGIDTFDFEVTR